jgi:choline dehydrogenase
VDTFDYVIIGAGSAGSVLASQLSEDPSTTVCLLEAGPRDSNPMIHIPAGFMKTFYDRSINWAYEQEPGPYTAGRRYMPPAGRRSAVPHRSMAT